MTETDIFADIGIKIFEPKPKLDLESRSILTEVLNDIASDTRFNDINKTIYNYPMMIVMELRYSARYYSYIAIDVENIALRSAVSTTRKSLSDPESFNDIKNGINSWLNHVRECNAARQQLYIIT